MVCGRCNNHVEEGGFCNHCGYKLNSNALTLSQLFAECEQYYFRRIGKDTQANYRAALNHLEPLHEKEFEGLRTKDFQDIIDCLGEFLGTSSLKKVKQLSSHLYSYAIMMDKVESSKNYAQYI